MRQYIHSATESYQFTTAGSDIDLITSRPNYSTDPNSGSPKRLAARALLITSGSGNLVVEYENGSQDTFEIASGATPLILPIQVALIDSTSSGGIKGNALY